MLINLIVAIGIGLLIGAERERRKGEGPARSPAGIRTFAVTSLAGAIGFIVGDELLLAIVTVGVIALTVIAYWRGHGDDPGLTTEIALILTVLLGGLSMQQPALAGGLAVVVAALLASRTRLHRFIRSVLTEDELNDILIFAGATFVVLPLIPDRSMGPYGALNPHSIWILVVLVMAIGGAGHIAVRMLGTRFGLPVAGLASGFVSSTATIAAMGTRVKAGTDVMAAAVAGAVLSTDNFYGSGVASESRGRGKKRTRVQFDDGCRVCLDPFMHHGRLRRASGMVWREWDHSGCSACRIR